jgi:hypothetical protein
LAKGFVKEKLAIPNAITYLWAFLATRFFSLNN